VFGVGVGVGDVVGVGVGDVVGVGVGDADGVNGQVQESPTLVDDIA